MTEVPRYSKRVLTHGFVICFLRINILTPTQVQGLNTKVRERKHTDRPIDMCRGEVAYRSRTSSQSNLSREQTIQDNFKRLEIRSNHENLGESLLER